MRLGYRIVGVRSGIVQGNISVACTWMRSFAGGCVLSKVDDEGRARRSGFQSQEFRKSQESFFVQTFNETTIGSKSYKDASICYGMIRQSYIHANDRQEHSNGNYIRTSLPLARFRRLSQNLILRSTTTPNCRLYFNLILVTHSKPRPKQTLSSRSLF